MPRVDRALLEAAKSGRRDAYAEIVRSHFRLAWVTALSIVHDPADAEDVVQDAFVRCWQRLGQCKSATAFSGWLRSIVRSVAFNHLDRERVRSAHSLEATEADGSESPERDLDRALLREELALAMRGLTTIQREVLLMYDLEGYPHAEIARLLNVSVCMSRRHLSNARQRMRRALVPPETRRVKE